MTSRRDLIIGATCGAGAALAWDLIPRRHVSLLGSRRLDSIIPRQFGEWVSRDVTDLVAPKTEDSLASRIYGQTVSRVYRRESSGSEIMMLMAHGDTQSDDLQVHRPEKCYPAVGFAISENARLSPPIGAGETLPGRRMVATAPDRREIIFYWTRLGEYFPVSERQQQVARLRTALRGVVADGLLARFSMIDPDLGSALTTMEGFVRQMVWATAPANRDVLVGIARARALATAVPA